MRLIVLLSIFFLMILIVKAIPPHFSTDPYPTPYSTFFNNRDWLCYDNRFGLTVSSGWDIDCCESNGHYASIRENQCCYDGASFCDSNGCCVNGVWHEGYTSSQCGSDSDCSYSSCGNGWRYYETCNLGKCMGNHVCDTSCGAYCCKDGDHYIIIKHRRYTQRVPLKCETFNDKKYAYYEARIFDRNIPCSTTLTFKSTDVCSCNEWLFCSLQKESINHASYDSGCSCKIEDIVTCNSIFNPTAIYNCDSGYYDCNNDGSDGCESSYGFITKYCDVTCGYDGTSWTILKSDCTTRKDASVCDIGDVV